MPKRAAADDTIDPVRSRLAAMAAAPQASPPPKTEPAPPAQAPIPAEEYEDEPETRAVGEGRRPALREPRRANRPQPRGVSRIMSVNRKIMVSESEAERMEETIAAISAAFGSKVNYSQVTRAVWSILAGAEDAIRAESKRAPNLRVPSKGDHIGMAEYEEAVADFLAMALKRS